MTTEQYDCLILGSGQAGGPLATALANAGRKTALIEREHVGGTCINEGCTPTKTMVASARVAYLARRGADYGVAHGPGDASIWQRCGSASATSSTSFRGGSERRIEATPERRPDLSARRASPGRRRCEVTPERRRARSD